MRDDEPAASVLVLTTLVLAYGSGALFAALDADAIVWPVALLAQVAVLGVAVAADRRADELASWVDRRARRFEARWDQRSGLARAAGVATFVLVPVCVVGLVLAALT